MDSKEYWLKREQEHAKQLRKDVSDKTQEIMIEYKRTLDNIEADINRNFVRYAKDGKMTMADAMKLADKMDVVRFADKAKQYVQEMDNSPQANADLKLYNLKMRVSRLQLLKSEIFLEIDKLAGKVNGETWRHLEKVAKLEYKRQAGILGKFLVFDDRKVNALVNASYKLNNGFVTFSNNVWHNTEMLKARLGNALNSAILQGKNPNEYISEFVKIFNAQPYQVGRLLITETARVQGDVQLDSYKQGEIEWYDISYESSACRICRRAASGGPYRHDRAVVGYNMYPFHPNCLCSIMPAEEPNLKLAKVDLVNITNAGLKQLGENMDILLDDYKHKTGIDVWDLISKNKFRDESKPYDDERARFMKHVYHRLGYDALPKQVKEYSDPNSKVYRGVRDSANMTAKEFLDNIKFGEMMISGAKSSSKGRGLYFTELVSYAKNHAKPNGLISEWGISDDVYSIGIKDLDSIGSRIKQLRALKDTSDWMDNQYDILAIAAGYDMIDAGSTKNIMNRGMLEWLKDTKYSQVT